MSASGDASRKGRGKRASNALTAVTDGVGHRRLVEIADSPETQNSLPRSAVVPSGTRSIVRNSSVRRQLPNDESLTNDANEPPLRRQRQVLQRCCDCSRSSTCALSRPTARSQACPCRVANKRCTSCACLGQCQNKRAPLPTTTATLRCFFAAPSATAPAENPQPQSPLPSQHQAPEANETPPSASPGIPTISDDDGDTPTTTPTTA